MRKLLAAALALLVLFAPLRFARAQQSLVGTGLRIVPQSSAPPSFGVGACTGGGPCIGLWSTTNGGNANRPIWRNSDGTDTVLYPSGGPGGNGMNGAYQTAADPSGNVISESQALGPIVIKNSNPSNTDFLSLQSSTGTAYFNFRPLEFRVRSGGAINFTNGHNVAPISAVGTGSLMYDGEQQAFMQSREGNGWELFVSPVNVSTPITGNGTNSPLACPTCVVTTGSYADPAWITSLSASKVSGLFYQTIQSNDVDQTQRGKLDFSSVFAYTDDAGGNRSKITIGSGAVTNAMLANSSVTLSAGTGVSVSGGGPLSLGGTATITNTGVTSLIAGGGVGVSGATGAVTLSTAAGGDATGALNALTVIKLQNRALVSTAPTNNQAIVWVNGNTDWEPQSIVNSLTSGQGVNVSSATGSISFTTASGGDTTGALSNQTVVALRGRTVAASAPSDTQYLGWVTANNDWEPTSLPTFPTIYYQTLQANGVDQTQRSKANFSTAFTLADDGGNSRTNITIATGGVSNAMLANSSVTLTGGTGVSVSGGGPLSLGGTATITNTGVTSLIAGGGVTVSAATGAVTLGSAGGGDVTGSYDVNTVIKIRNRAVISTAPTDKQAYVWVNANSDWEPQGIVNSIASGQGVNVSASTGALSITTAPGGDLSGTLDSANVIKIRNRAVVSTAPTDKQVYVWVNGNTDWEPQGIVNSAVAGSGVTVSAATGNVTFSIANGAITNAMLANSSVTLSAGTGMSVSGGGPLSLGGTATITLANTAVTPGTYGDGTHTSTFTVDQQGRLTAASTSGTLLATDSLVVHLAGTETITGQKTFPAAGASAVRIPAIYAGASNTNGHTVPNVADDTFALLAATQEFTNKTENGSVIKNGLTATGSTSNNFSGSSGPFLTSTGAVTIGSGAVSITGDITLASGKNFTATGGASAFDWSAASGVTKLTTGTYTFPTATIILGANDASGTAAAITMRGAGMSGVSNTSGPNLTMAAGTGTGTGTPSAIVLQAPPTTTTGTNVQTAADVLRVTYTTTTPLLIFGSGEASATPLGGMLRAPNATGTNIAGSSMTIQGSLATGNANSGDIIFKVGQVGSTGSSQEPAVTPLTLKGNIGTSGQIVVMNGSFNGINANVYINTTTTNGTAITMDAGANSGGGTAYMLYAAGSGAGIGGGKFGLLDNSTGDTKWTWGHSGSQANFWTTNSSAIGINGANGSASKTYQTLSNSLTIFGGKFLEQATPLPAAPTVATGLGSGTTEYCYAVLPLDAFNNIGVASSIACATNAATLDASHTITITLPSAVAGSNSGYVYRVVSNGTPSSVGLIGSSTAWGGSITDNGLTANGATPPTRNPSSDFITSGSISISPANESPSNTLWARGGGIVIAQVTTPSAPTLSITGGSATTYKYRTVCHDMYPAANSSTAIGQTAQSALVTTAVGPTTLDTTHFIDITPNVPNGCVTFDIIRDTGGSNQGYIYQNVSGSGSFRDYGISATAYTSPTANTTGYVKSDRAIHQHFVADGSAPTVAVGNAAQLGTGPAAAITQGGDAGFVMTFTSGTGPSALVANTAVTIGTITFNETYSVAPRAVDCSPANGVTAAIATGTGIVFYADYTTASTTGVTIKAISSGTPSFAASTAYPVVCTVIE